jgi:hypothetical protein
MDTQGNIVVGGGSSDSSLVSATSVPNPIVIFYSKSGKIFWSMTMNTYINYVTALKFRPDG